MAVPGAMRSNAKTLIGLHLCLAERWCENPRSIKGPTQCQSGSSNNILVSTSNHLSYHFSITISSTSLVFTPKSIFMKIIKQSAHRTNYWVWVEGALAPWPYIYCTNNQYLNCRGDGRRRVPQSRVSVPPSRLSVPPSRFRCPLIEIWALDDQRKNTYKIRSNIAPNYAGKVIQKEKHFNRRRRPFFWSSHTFSEKKSVFGENLFLFWSLFNFVDGIT